MSALSADELAIIQGELATTTGMLSAIPAVGGILWNVSKAGTGDGIHSRPGNDVPVGTIVANVFVNIPPLLRGSGALVSLAGQDVQSDVWWLVADAAFTTQLANGRSVVSQDNPSMYSFTVNATYHLPGYVIARMTKPGG